jgi:excisionase family DNA binding protein
MKIEIDDKELIASIVKEVVEQLTPLIKNTNDSVDNDPMTVEEVAKYLKVTKSFVYEKIHKKEIPFYKVGRLPRFSKKHIDLWKFNPYHQDLHIYNLNYNRKGVKK